MTFSWTHNGTIIRPSSTTSTLKVTNMMYHDSGSYVCTVRSGSVLVMSNTAEITVYGKVKCILCNNHHCIVLAPIPVIDIHPVSKKVTALRNVTFTCQASVSIRSSSKLSYSWHRYNGTIPNKRLNGYNTNTLTIIKAIPPDEGLYYCTASNNFGSSSSKIAFLMVDGEYTSVILVIFMYFVQIS